MKYLFLSAFSALLAFAPVAYAQDISDCIEFAKAENGWTDGDLSSLQPGQTISYQGETAQILSGGTASLACKEILYGLALREMETLRARNVELFGQNVTKEGQITVKNREITDLKNRVTALEGRTVFERHPRTLLAVIFALIALAIFQWLRRNYRPPLNELNGRMKLKGPLVN